MEDTEIIHKQKTVGHISGSILLEYSYLIKVTLDNIQKMDNKLVTKINMDNIFNDVYKKEPYFYNGELEIDWKQVLSIINDQNFIILNNKSLSKYFYNKLNEVKVAAILTNYYRMEKLHNILITTIKKYYSGETFLKLEKKYITQEAYEYAIYNCNNDIMGDLIKYYPQYITKKIYKYVLDNCNKDIVGDLIKYYPKYVTRETYEYYFKLIKDEYMLAVITNDSEKLYNEERQNYFMTNKCEMMLDIIKKGYANSEFNMYKIEIYFCYTYTYNNGNILFNDRSGEEGGYDLIITADDNKYLYIDANKLYFDIDSYYEESIICKEDLTDILCNIKKPDNIEIERNKEFSYARCKSPDYDLCPKDYAPYCSGCEIRSLPQIYYYSSIYRDAYIISKEKRKK